MSEDEGKLLYDQEVEGVEEIHIGGDAEGFYLDLCRAESEGGGGVRIRLTPHEREVLRDKFGVPDRPTQGEGDDSSD